MQEDRLTIWDMDNPTKLDAEAFPEGFRMIVTKDYLQDVDPDALGIGSELWLVSAAVLSKAGVTRIRVSDGREVTIDDQGDGYRLAVYRDSTGPCAVSGTVVHLITGTVTEIH